MWAMDTNVPAPLEVRELFRLEKRAEDGTLVEILIGASDLPYLVRERPGSGTREIIEIATPAS
jgi:hypothetical protein